MRLLGILLATVLAAGGCLNDIPGVNGSHDMEATDFVSGKDYTKWVIEVDYADGHAPDQALLTFLHDRLAPLVKKTDGVEFHVDEALTDQPTTEWDADAILSYGKQHQGTKTEGNTAVLHVLFITGHHKNDVAGRSVLGVTIGHGIIAIFVDSMQRLCDGPIQGVPLPGCTTAPYYRSVVLHEFGHAIGLVDNGIPMVRDHQASDCNGAKDTGHSSNDQSVMTCAVESSGNILGFGNNPPTSFDSDDLADLQAARNA